MYLNKFIKSQENGIIRIANELIIRSNIDSNKNLSACDVGQFTEKQMHGYLFKKVKEEDQIHKSTSWTTDKYIWYLILKDMRSLFMNRRKLTPKIQNFDVT